MRADGVPKTQIIMGLAKLSKMAGQEAVGAARGDGVSDDFRSTSGGARRGRSAAAGEGELLEPENGGERMAGEDAGNIHSLRRPANRFENRRGGTCGGFERGLPAEFARRDPRQRT